jgi:trimeric autotransporter adhesin
MAKTNKGRKLFATTATAALVASAIVPVASAAQINDFNTISSYAQEAVQDLVDRGVIQGDEKGNFNPRKSVTRAEAATILVNALELESTGSINFTDVKAGAWYYDAINAAVNNGIFQGQGAGKFNPSGNLTRSEAAIILVDAFGLEGSASLSQFSDSASVKAWAQEALEIAVANGVIKGDNGKLNPNAPITRQDFAVMYSRTEGVEAPVSGAIKAINNTTVEITFEDNIDDVKALEFTIDGLEVKSAVVKQTNAKTVVLTTAAQEAGKTYKLSIDGEEVGSFTGVAAVIPTAVNVTTSSLQGVIGKEVTIKAQVTVPDGQSKENIPVTFNITSNSSNTDKVEVEALTNAEGVASYSYTRYYASEDTFTAYATDKASVYSNGKVYWANNIQLAVSELTTGNELANEAKKSYKVAGKANTTYYIAIKENLGVTPDKITNVKVQNYNTTATTDDDFVTPYTLSTSSQNQLAAVRTNSNGEGSFTVYGSNLTATPIVYSPESTPTTPETYTYNKLDLQAEAPTVKFSQIDKLALAVVGEGSLNSAESAVNLATGTVAPDATSVGGRTYTVTVTDKDGKVAPAGTTAYVTFEAGNYSIATGGGLYFSTGSSNFESILKADGTPKVLAIKVGAAGKAQFRVAGNGATTFVKPTVFLNTAGSTTTPALDKTDISTVAEVTYFKAASVTSAELSVEDEYGRAVATLNAGKDAFFTYQSVDQNGFPYRPTGITSGNTTSVVWVPVYDANGAIIRFEQQTINNPGNTSYEYTLAFDVSSLYGNVTVKDAAGNALNPTNPSQNLGNTKTYHVKSDADGKAIVRVTSSGTDTVTVNVTGANTILPTKSATVGFVDSVIVPDVYSGVVESYNSTAGTLKFAGKNSVPLLGNNIVYTKGNEVIANYDAFVALLAGAPGTVSITRTVKDGVTTFNIYNISTTGTKPADTAPQGTLAYTDINGTVGTAITATPVVTGLPSGAAITYSASTLPAGLTINSATGVISGTPTAVTAATTVTVNATYTNTVGLPVTITDTLTITVAASAGATAVQSQIAALPAVGTLAYANKAAVDAARTAYNALSAADQALVTNEATLSAAEAEITRLGNVIASVTAPTVTNATGTYADHAAVLAALGSTVTVTKVDGTTATANVVWTASADYDAAATSTVVTYTGVVTPTAPVTQPATAIDVTVTVTK